MISSLASVVDYSINSSRILSRLRVSAGKKDRNAHNFEQIVDGKASKIGIIG